MIRLFGGLSFEPATPQQGESAPRRVAMLFAALALAGPRGMRREQLCALFWQDRPEPQARGSLRQCLTAARRALAGLGGEIKLDSDATLCRLAGPADAIDLWQFDHLTRRSDPEDLTVAADLYAGDVLAGTSGPEPFEQWAQPIQRAYRRTALHLAEKLSGLAVPGNSAAAIACEHLANRLLAQDSTAEEAHRALIRLHMRAGHPNRARRQFKLCREALHRELGTSPEEETVALLAGDHVHVPDPATLPPAQEAPTRRTSIAVLPFRNLSADQAEEYFVDGVVDEVIAALSRVRGLMVVGRNSSFAFRGVERGPKQIAADLGVRYILMGSVRKSGSRVRATAELIDGSDGGNVWADRFDGDVADVFDLQDSLTEAIVGAILPSIRSSEIDRARRKRPDSMDAYDCVMRAMPAVWSNAQDTAQEALDLLERAIAMDPGYALAKSLAAWIRIQHVIYLRSADPQKDRERAFDLAEEAASLDRDDPLVLTTLSAAHTLTGNLDRAAAFIEEALRRDPNSAWAWQRSGWILTYKGLSDPAIDHFERGLRISPFDPINFNSYVGIGTAHFAAGRYDRAAAFIQKGVDVQPDALWAHRILAPSLAQAGRLDEARQSAKLLLSRYPQFTIAAHMRNPLFQTPFLPRIVEGLQLAGLPMGEL
ncbi:hypothetical protein C4E04_01315 [Microvirga sp. 17 mud 1-3]|nr:hypothetical protein C4E04_01315 [Microvirga sp. 17 mud 1-3]